MNKFVIFLPALFIAIQLHAQVPPNSSLKKLDHLFEKWNNPNSPGCAIGIVRNDSLIFSKGFGMANLEYDVPISSSTIFHMASVSKQFTGFSTILLAKQGKLQLDDDIRIYLPWFPDLKEKITIRHLLNHTSGIRDQWQLLAISGTRLDDVITQEHILKLLSQQKALNSRPGERYNYSNSGYTLLAEIIKAVTGQTLRQFTDSAIFKPLHMHDTHFHDDYKEIVKNRAYSYNREDSTHYANSVLSYSTVGATSLFTTINDLSKWLMNFYTHKVGDQQDIDLLTQRGQLNNGQEIDYASGIINITLNGWKGFSHAGSDAGFRTVMSVFPDLKMGFMIFANVSDFNSSDKGLKLASLFIQDTTKAALEENDIDVDSSQAILKNPEAIKKFLGNYITDEGIRRHFRLKDNKLYAETNGRSDLLKENRDSFHVFTNPAIKFAFGINHLGDTIATAILASGEKEVFTKYTTSYPTNQALKEYTGTYYCPELDCKYNVTLKNGRLILTNNKYSDMPLTLANRDHLLNDYWWMSHLLVLRDDNDKIIGFEVNNGRVLHLKFNKR